MGLLLVLFAAGCGFDSAESGTTTSSSTGSGGSGSGTELTVDGVATRSTQDPTAAPIEVPFAGTLDCRGTPSGTGMFATTATEACRQVIAHPRVFETVRADPARVCTEIYGGPQRAKITGTVSATPVDLEVTRTDGCGIDDWSRLEWLLGPPER